MFKKTSSSCLAASILTIAVLLTVPESVFGGSLFLSWDPIQDSRLSGYKIKYGTAPGSYVLSVDVGNKTYHTLQGLTEGVRYHIVIVGYDTNRVEGTASTETLGLGPCGFGHFDQLRWRLTLQWFPGKRTSQRIVR